MKYELRKDEVKNVEVYLGYGKTRFIDAIISDADRIDIKNKEEIK